MVDLKTPLFFPSPVHTIRSTLDSVVGTVVCLLAPSPINPISLIPTFADQVRSQAQWCPEQSLDPWIFNLSFR